MHSHKIVKVLMDAVEYTLMQMMGRNIPLRSNFHLGNENEYNQIENDLMTEYREYLWAVEPESMMKKLSRLGQHE